MPTWETVFLILTAILLLWGAATGQLGVAGPGTL